jgi:hypothetical protein
MARGFRVTDDVTQDQLEQACREWARRLRLQDWRVTVRWQDWVSMSILGRSGEVQWNLQAKSAVVYILPPGQRCDGNPEMAEGDWERTLVHELLHLHLAAWSAPDGSLEDAAQEQAINAIAEALVNLAREGRP